VSTAFPGGIGPIFFPILHQGSYLANLHQSLRYVQHYTSEAADIIEMPPRKPTSKDGTKERETDDPTTLILTYLRAQNRPYSATEISSNLHNKVTKTKTDKLLKEMYERKEIMGKTVGKASIYWGLQVRMCVCVCVWRVKLGRMKE
jgi:hypothetical protein